MSRRRRGRWIGVAREVGGSLVDFNDALHEVRIQRGTDHETCSREVSRSYAGIFRFTRNGDCSPTRREEHVEQENAYLTLGLGCRGHFFFCRGEVGLTDTDPLNCRLTLNRHHERTGCLR